MLSGASGPPPPPRGQQQATQQIQQPSMQPQQQPSGLAKRMIFFSDTVYFLSLLQFFTQKNQKRQLK